MLRHLLSTVAALAASAEEEHLSLLQTQVERFAKKSADSLAHAGEEDRQNSSLAHAGEESQQGTCGFRNGALTSGSDFGSAVATIQMAMEYCETTAGCVGFTYQGGHGSSNMNEWKQIYYKSAFNLQTTLTPTTEPETTSWGETTAEPETTVEPPETTAQPETTLAPQANSGWSAYRSCSCGFTTGALASGSDTGSVVATIQMAIDHCDATAGCAGFTYKGGYQNMNEWKNIFYKSKFILSVDAGSGAWSAYKSCPGKYHMECWTAGGCDDDGANVCNWCGHKNGKQMYCCSGKAAAWLGPGGYPSNHKCHNSKFKTGAGYNGHHHCVLPR